MDDHDASHDARPSMPTSGRASDGDGESLQAASVRQEGVAGAHQADANWLLRALPVADYGWLLPQLTPVRLRLKQTLIEADSPIPYVWFVREGVVSLVATRQEGGDVEVGTVGHEGLVGLPVLFEDDTMPNHTMVQVEGDAWRIPVDAFRRAIDARPALRKRCLLYAAYFVRELSQSVACNRLHTLEERAARWLLMTHDRVAEADFEITHEFLALMLGVRRSGVSVAMGTLQAAGILRYRRGRVEVLDRGQLEAASCDCYRITRAALDRLVR